MKKVKILLSTHNGEKYLAQLLDSLISQDYPNMEISVRDDGSTDGALKILKSYAGRELEVIQGSNIGVIGSFFELIKNSRGNARYLALCDQDDVWLSDKISRAVSRLEEFDCEKEILLYCSNVIVVDESLNPVSGVPRGKVSPSFRNALVQNIARGCTCVFNRSAADMFLLASPDLRNIIMHDWWLYLIASSMGTVIYDDEPGLFYRQHSFNLVGHSHGIFSWGGRAKRFIETRNERLLTEQARAFYRTFRRHLPPGEKQLLEKFVFGRNTFLERCRFIREAGCFRQAALDDAVLKMLIMLGLV